MLIVFCCSLVNTRLSHYPDPSCVIVTPRITLLSTDYSHCSHISDQLQIRIKTHCTYDIILDDPVFKYLCLGSHGADLLAQLVSVWSLSGHCLQGRQGQDLRPAGLQQTSEGGRQHRGQEGSQGGVGL